ncbi:MAG: DinB family protein [Acidobacteria bacterium]|nr:DinB family protein [Acidobacteriota bacterium]
MTRNELEDLARFLEETPAKISRLAEGLNETESRWKPAPNEFSVVENVCHLRDIELDGYALRIQKILREDEPFLPDLNGAQLAQERLYNEQELEAALDAFKDARRTNVLALKNLSPAELERRGVFENTGAITLSRLLEMMREHDMAHLAELKGLRDRLAHA